MEFFFPTQKKGKRKEKNRRVYAYPNGTKEEKKDLGEINLRQKSPLITLRGLFPQQFHGHVCYYTRPKKVSGGHFGNNPEFSFSQGLWIGWWSRNIMIR